MNKRAFFSIVETMLLLAGYSKNVSVSHYIKGYFQNMTEN